MTKSIKELDEMRQEFVSNVSHEFQSPLSSIQGFSKTLQTEKMSEEERNHYLQIIEGESKRMSSLCKQLLTLASLDKEEKVLQIKDFSLQNKLKTSFLCLNGNGGKISPLNLMCRTLQFKVMKTYFIKYGVTFSRIALSFQTMVERLSFRGRVRV